MSRHEISAEIYQDMIARNIPNVIAETETRYYIVFPETNGPVVETETEEPRKRKSPQIKRLKSDRLSLVHNWEFLVSKLAWEYRDYLKHMAVVLEKNNGWLTSADLTRAMFALDLGPTIDCISGRNGTLIERGILEVNAPFTRGLAVSPAKVDTPILQFPFSIPDQQITTQ